MDATSLGHSRCRWDLPACGGLIRSVSRPKQLPSWSCELTRPYLSVWGNHGPTVVRIEEGTGAVHVNMRVGSIMSVLGTATGRVFAAFLPPKMIENFIESGVGRASVGDEAERQMTRKQIDASLAEIRENGLARAVERPIPGVNAFSAPVFDHAGSIALVMTAIGPSHTFDADWDGPIAAEVRKCAADVSARLGFSAKGSKAA